MKKYKYHYDSPVGRLFLAEVDGAITDLVFTPIEDAEKKQTPVLSLACDILREYFAGERREFDIPMKFIVGTEFQQKAWNALSDIPYGQTRSYQDQANAIGSPKACRAVGSANGKNPISIFVPCHRVIGANKSLTGYGGGLDIKKFLLELEAQHINK